MAPDTTWRDRPRDAFGQLAAIRDGEGPTVLLLHGVGLRAEAWAAQIDALAPRHTVIAPDMAGHGHSAGFSQSPALADYADRVAEALDTPAHLVGHSMGALIALDLAARYPHLARSVTAVNAVYQRPPDAARAIRARAAAMSDDAPPDPSAPLDRWFGAVPSAARDACERWLRAAPATGYNQAYTLFAHHDAGDVPLHAIKAPVMCVTGSDDPNSTPDMSRALASATGGTAHVIDGAAHMLPMTHADTLTPLLTRHFTGA
ncbi:alpha/beta fold hydrolase [Pseudaestuariivita atlantica]|uniref:AB hydrolase-1 domain-containing protein n=1 Tax=Pseudaestuariivita atlantica TaxID=1317121 RepID=A0A0L1JNS2_9RHOB|nr:alpha/beta fold hydrolase [Pseudaestuariivita atlantica]KNG93406.1 hypothetical protein ATO11_13345 [Pseudaestuariivita atlantica]